jgi:hypothetical protein
MGHRVLVTVIAAIALSGCTALITDNRTFLQACAEGEQRIDRKLCYAEDPVVWFRAWATRHTSGEPPRPFYTGETVGFSAYAVHSREPSGPFELAWDLDGDGEYDDRIGPYIRPDTFGQGAQVTTTMYYEPGLYEVGLKLMEGEKVATASREIRVVERPADTASQPRGVGPARASAPPRRGAARSRPRSSRFSATLSMSSLRLGEPEESPKTVRIAGQILLGEFDGRLLKGGGRRTNAAATSLKAFLTSSWLTEVSSTLRRKDEVVTTRGLAVATFEDAVGAACVRYSISAEDGRGKGRMRLLGGTGAAEKLAASARFSARGRLTDLRLRGTITARKSSPRNLPASCANLSQDLE